MASLINFVVVDVYAEDKDLLGNVIEVRLLEQFVVRMRDLRKFLECFRDDVKIKLYSYPEGVPVSKEDLGL